MKYHEDCPHCGRRTTAYTLHLTENLCCAFLIFADARIRAGRPLAKGEIQLTNSQYSNFQNLRHFGIITQPEGKGNCWELTRLGLAFYHGTASLPTPTAHLAGRTLEPDHLAWSTHDGPRHNVTITMMLPEEPARRADYAEQKTGMGPIDRATPARDLEHQHSAAQAP